MTVRVDDPFGLVELDRTFPSTTDARRDAPGRPAPADPAGRDLDRLRRQPAARLRRRQRRGRHRPGVPPRRRPAPRALALERPRRRAHGAPRGAALAVARHALPRQPAPRAPRRRARLVAGVRRRSRPPRSPCTWPSAASGCGSSPPTATRPRRPGTSTARSHPRPGRCSSRSRCCSRVEQAHLRTTVARRCPPDRPARRGARRARAATTVGARRMRHAAEHRRSRSSLDVDRWARRRAPRPGRSRGPRSGRGTRRAARRAAAGARSPPAPRRRCPTVWQQLGAHRAPSRPEARRRPWGRVLVNRLHLPRVDRSSLAVLAAASTFFTLLSLGRARRRLQRLPRPAVLDRPASPRWLGLALRTLRRPLRARPGRPGAPRGGSASTTCGRPRTRARRVDPDPGLAARESVLVLADGARQAAQWPAPSPAGRDDFPALMLGIGAVVVLARRPPRLHAAPRARSPAAAPRRVHRAGQPPRRGLLGGVRARGAVLRLPARRRPGGPAGSVGPHARADVARDVVDNQPHQVRLGTLWPTGDAARAWPGSGSPSSRRPCCRRSSALFDGSGPGDGDGNGDGHDREPDGRHPARPDPRRRRRRWSGRDRRPRPGYLRAHRAGRLRRHALAALRARHPAEPDAADGLPAAARACPRRPPRTTYTASRSPSATTSRSRWLPTPYPAHVGARRRATGATTSTRSTSSAATRTSPPPGSPTTSVGERGRPRRGGAGRGAAGAPQPSSSPSTDAAPTDAALVGDLAQR